MQQLVSNEPSPSYIQEPNKYLSFCVSALMLSVSSVANNISNSDSGILPSANCKLMYQKNITEYDCDILEDFTTAQANDNHDQENADVFSEFFYKLTANMKTLPFEAFEDIAKRPWDFV